MVNKTNPTIPAALIRPEHIKSNPKADRAGAFASVLDRETDRRASLSISTHANKRLNSSQVKLTDSDMQRINGAVERLRDKGSNQSVVMLDNLALVVSIKNSVVITAVDEARANKPVFTNIDSVVIA